MAKFINPFTDVGFKKIFGQEVSKDLLIDFLNDLLVDEKSITDITFLDKEILPEYMGDVVSSTTFTVRLRTASSLSSRCRTASRLISANALCIIFPMPFLAKGRRVPTGVSA